MKIVITMDWRRIYDPTTGERVYDKLTRDQQEELTTNALEHIYKEITVAEHTSGQLLAENADGWWSIASEDEDPDLQHTVIPNKLLAKVSGKTLEKLGLSITKNTTQRKGRMNGK